MYLFTPSYQIAGYELRILLAKIFILALGGGDVSI